MPEPQTTDEALTALRERVRSTQEAAERIVREATERAEAGGGEAVPPRGWQEAGGEEAGALSGEVQALVGLLAAARELLPPDLRAQVAELVRQLLLVLRTLIDWLVERLDRAPRGAEPPVQDIPIGT